MQYTELLDKVLGILYLLKIENKKTGYYSLKEIISSVLKYPSSPYDIREIGKYLEAQGFVKAIYNFQGVYGEITTSGIVYIERKGEEFINELKKYIDKVDNLEKSAKGEHDITNPTLESVKKEREPIYDMLNKLKDIVTEKIQPNNYDILKDIEILQSELEKLNPDKEIVGNKLNAISSIDILRYYYNDLINILNI